jgi:hypothetical protein
VVTRCACRLDAAAAAARARARADALPDKDFDPRRTVGSSTRFVFNLSLGLLHVCQGVRARGAV